MFRRIPSIRLKVILIVMVTSFTSLLFAGAVLVAHDVRSYRASWGRDLMIQADIVGRMSASALVFGDTLTAHQSLAVLAIRPEIRVAAVYTRLGRLFASYVGRDGADADFPAALGTDGYRFLGDRLLLFKSIRDADGRVGTIYLSARYDPGARLSRYLGVLLVVLLGSLLLALLMSWALQSSVTAPLLAVATVARDVRAKRNFSLRVAKTTTDETGRLVDAFNAMLVEVNEAQRSLIESGRRKDEFLATLAHELRNPLGPIRNAAQYLRLKQLDHDSDTVLELIERQVQQMARLIEDLLDISRISRDKVELRLSEFKVQGLIDDVVGATEYAVRDAGQQLRLRIEGGGTVVQADRVRLIQVVSNLLHNAVKYTPRGGRIELAVAPRDRDLVITVTDNGIGIPPDRIDSIFEPFSQLDQSLEKTRGGLGIGLALSQRLVALHGGTLVGSSAGLGLGSTFRVTLPIVRERASLPPPAPEAVPPAGRPLHVLVADDNVDGADTLAILLRTKGHEVQIAHDGIEAFERLESRPFDVAVLDIGMPRLNGYDLARRIRQQPWGAALVLVALTGWGQAGDRQRAHDAGFDLHLTKPVDPSQLNAAITSLRAEGRPA